MPSQKLECEKCDSIRFIERKYATDPSAKFYCETCRGYRRPSRLSRRYDRMPFGGRVKMYTRKEWDALAPEAQSEILRGR